MQQALTIAIIVICVAIAVYRIVRRVSRKRRNPCDGCADSGSCGCSGAGSSTAHKRGNGQCCD